MQIINIHIHSISLLSNNILLYYIPFGARFNPYDGITTNSRAHSPSISPTTLAYIYHIILSVAFQFITWCKTYTIIVNNARSHLCIWRQLVAGLVLDQKSENGWISMWNVKIMSMFKLHLMSRQLKSFAGSKLMCMEHITWRSCILRFIWNVNSKWHVTAKCVSNVYAPPNTWTNVLRKMLEKKT